MNPVEKTLKWLETLPPEEKYLLTQRVLDTQQRLKFVPNPGPQTEAYLSPADIMLYGGAGGSGKQLDLDTLIPVPEGYKRIGDIEIGDIVFGEYGEQKKVIAVTEPEEAESYAVFFDSGEIIYADARHLWKTMTSTDRSRATALTDEWREKRRNKRKSRSKESPNGAWRQKNMVAVNKSREFEYKAVPTGGIRTTREILDTLYFRKGDKEKNHSINVSAPLQCSHKTLPMDPYLLGLWLGDGYKASGCIGMAKEDFCHLLKHLPAPSSIIEDCRPPRKKIFMMVRFDGFQSCLRKNGLIGFKHIPIEYLRSSIEDRISLLQGLMDTDGTCNKNGYMELGFSDERLATDALDLICSLGIKANITTKVPTLNGKKHKTHYRIKFVSNIPLFRLERKAQRQKLSGFRKTTERRYIVDIKPAGVRKMRCIQVEDDGGMYLVGRSYIPTHNSSLLSGLALMCHRRSLLLRRKYSDLAALTEEVIKTHGSRDGFTGGGRPKLRTEDGRLIEFGACQHPGDEESLQGIAHDLKGYDEVTHFLEKQVRYINGWNRPGPGVPSDQRCRIVFASNPPTSSDGDWIIPFFGPWLDPNHPNPAKPGELRWFVTDPDGRDQEVDGPQKVSFPGRKEPVTPKSRTFIPGKLSDNPYLANSGYAATLDSLPEPLRSALRDGNFMLSRADTQNQVIPTQWVRAAQARWTEHPPAGLPMTAMGVDIAQGGSDSTVIARRHDYWFDKIIDVPGKQTPEGSDVAALVVKYRRDGATVILDMGGGYGGAPNVHLKDSDIKTVPFKGVLKTNGRDRHGNLGFTNRRSEAWWMFREALDPDQTGGARVALPDDQRLVSDLTAPTFETVRHNGRMCIQVEPKDAVKKRLGRSTDKADAVIMAWYDGVKGLTAPKLGSDTEHGTPPALHRSAPTVNLGHKNKRRK